MNKKNQTKQQQQLKSSTPNKVRRISEAAVDDDDCLDQDSSSSSSDSMRDLNSIVDLQIEEKVEKYVNECEVSVSSNAEYICIGPSGEHSSIFYSIHVSPEGHFDWSKGFKKAYLSQFNEAEEEEEEEQLRIESSSFSDFEYILD